MIKVTSPLLPQLEEFIPYLQQIWSSEWLTNNGEMHQRLESELCRYLQIQHLSLFTNGTLPLITALQALNIQGEVITTPFSFVATTHALWWNGIKPVFVDIDPKTCNMDPDKIESAITSRTSAILPVHCYGNPCDFERIQKIADKYGLKVIYDAAHAFGVEVNGESILTEGDMSTLSFHATKVFNTAEGGALVVRNHEMKKKVDFLKNFGFAGETEVVSPGINGKMDEIRAALGLLNLKIVDRAIARRKEIAQMYRSFLKSIPGLRYFEDFKNVKHNYSYFPIFVSGHEYGESRDELYERLKSNGVYGRRYFYPLISSFSTYNGLESSSHKNLPFANKIANEVICLPIHQDLKDEEVDMVVKCIKNER